MVYLDNSATTRVMDCAAQAVLYAMQNDFYNPAAAYTPAASAEKEIDHARDRLAALLGGTRSEIIYTSGGTESNNTAIFGTLETVRGKKRIITSAVEHPSVYEVFKKLEHDPDTEVVVLPVTKTGAVDPDALRDALTENTAVISIDAPAEAISATTAGLRNSSVCFISLEFLLRVYTYASRVTIIIDGNTQPSVETIAPNTPAMRMPTKVAEFIAIGPGVISAMVIRSANSE